MIDAQEIGAGELAKLLGISGARVQQLVSEGVLTRLGRGRFALGAAVRGYCDLLRKVAKRPERARAGDVRYRHARASKIEHELARLRGQVAPIEMLEEQMVNLAGMFVAALEGTEAQLKRLVGEKHAPLVAAECKRMRDQLTAGVERYIEKLEAGATR